MNDFDKALDELMDWFDFEKSFKVLQHVPDCWINHKEAPCVADLRVFARDNLRRAYKTTAEEGTKKVHYTTGCFEFHCEVEDDSVYLGLKLVPCEWDVFVENGEFKY